MPLHACVCLRVCLMCCARDGVVLHVIQLLTASPRAAPSFFLSPSLASCFTLGRHALHARVLMRVWHSCGAVGWGGGRGGGAVGEGGEGDGWMPGRGEGERGVARRVRCRFHRRGFLLLCACFKFCQRRPAPRASASASPSLVSCMSTRRRTRIPSQRESPAPPPHTHTHTHTSMSRLHLARLRLSCVLPSYLALFRCALSWCIC